MWIIKNRNPALGFYSHEGWNLDETKANQYPSGGHADLVIAQYGMSADSVEIQPKEPQPE